MSLELLNEALNAIRSDKVTDDLCQRVQELADKDFGWMLVGEAMIAVQGL